MSLYESIALIWFDMMSFTDRCCNQGDVLTEPFIAACHSKEAYQFLLAFRNRVVHDRLY